MRCESGHGLPAIILSVGLICAGLLAQTRAQTATPNTQTFGSSLKRSKTSAGGQPRKTGPKTTDSGLPSAEDVVRVDTSLVLLDLLVTDASGSKYISGLTRDDFIVTEDDRPQEISTFTLGDDAARLPRSIVLIFDRSDSQLAYLDASIKAAKRLVAQLKPTDEMAIVTDDVQLAVGFTKDKKKLKQTLDSLRKWTLEGYRTRSMQFSALLATLRELIGPERRRPIIIFQTDGDEVGRLSGWPPVAGEQVTEYGYGMNDVYAEAEKSRAKIYTVIPNDRLIGLPEGEADRRALLMLDKQRAAQAKTRDMWYGYKRLPPEATSGSTASGIPEGGLKELRSKLIKRAVDTFVQGQVAAARVAEITGGWASFLESPDDAYDVYGRILADINRRYIIGYYPTDRELDGKLRRVQVEVRGHPEYVVQGSRSYYAGSR